MGGSGGGFFSGRASPDDLARKTREVMPTIQGYARQMATGAEDVSSRITTPVINTQARAARVRGMWFQATRPLRGSSPPDETTPN